MVNTTSKIQDFSEKIFSQEGDTKRLIKKFKRASMRH